MNVSHVRFLFFIAAFIFISQPVLSESCDTDCHRQCRVRTDFPPVEFIEPVCHAKCEVAKKAACAAGQSIPTIPLTPREQVETFGNQACAVPFQAITGAVIARCSNWDGRLERQELISAAVQRLIAIRAISGDELNGVQVRWCPLSGAHGMAPDRGRIYLDTSLQGNPFATASTLAHEIMHIRQYRRAGSDRFKCEYSRQYAECGGCQDNRNSFEREAYEFENSIRPQLAASFNNVQGPSPQSTGIPVRFCQTPYFTCNLPPTMLPLGTPCYCNAPNGQQIPGSAF